MRGWMVLLVIGGVGLVFGRSLLLALFTDTEYGVGYSERGFDGVLVGGAREEVLRVLGKPLSVDGVVPSVRWLYCGPEHSGFRVDGSVAGSFSLLTFDLEGMVVGAFGQTTSGESRFGGSVRVTMDGGPLGASVGGILGEPSSLLGLSAKEVVSRFGPPRFVDEDLATEVLVYSRSPSSTHYLLRRIRVDANGRVVRKDRYLYWD